MWDARDIKRAARSRLPCPPAPQLHPVLGQGVADKQGWQRRNAGLQRGLAEQKSFLLLAHLPI